MKLWWLVLLVPGGSLLIVLELLRRRQQRLRAPLRQTPNWRTFFSSPAAEGEPTIRRVKIGAVKPLKGETSPWWHEQRTGTED